MRNFPKKAGIAPLALVLALAISCKGAPEASGANVPAGAGTAENGAENIVFVPGFNDVVGIEWRLIGVRASAENAAARFSRRELAEIGMENAYTLHFDGKQLSGVAAPNRYFAPYEEGAGKALSIRAIAGTLMTAFREPENLKEREYFDYLENTGRWDLVRNQLQLYTRDGQGRAAVLIFEAG
ncbi:MAG: META domain-containing protein [Spirochaetaceae bacterium]|jgi:hypothetical protein|nr:META domain-containing protein [Spirochaetaceae bacterium]